MAAATLTSKGQITIPAAVRHALGVDTGDRVEFVEVEAGRYEVIAATSPVTALKGMFGKARKSVSIEQMNAAIARRGAAAKDFVQVMIGLDTNVLVRHIMQDDAAQSAAASRLLESLGAEASGFVPLVAVAELAWVLSAAYDLDRAQVVAAFEALLRTKEIVVEQAETVWKALRVFAGSNADFADCLIARSATAAGCARAMTFDRAAAKGCGMTLVG